MHTSSVAGALDDCKSVICVLWLYFVLRPLFFFFLPRSRPIPLWRALAIRRGIMTAVLSLDVYQQYRADAAVAVLLDE